MFRRLALLAVTASLLSSCMMNVKLPVNELTGGASPSGRQRIVIAVAQANLDAHKGKWWRYLTFPTFRAVTGNPLVAEDIAADLNSVVRKRVREFRSSAIESFSQAQSAAELGWLDLSVPRVQFDDRLIAVEFLDYSSATNAAHPFSYRYSRVYDSLSADPVTLLDSVLPERKAELLTLINAAISASGNAAELDDPQTRLDDLQAAGALDGWFPSRDALELNFAPYVVGPYAAGEVSIWLSWSQVAPLLDPKSMLGKFANAHS